MNTPFDALLVCNRSDEQQVREITKRLRGVKLWLDEEQIEGGDDSYEEIKEGLSNSKSVVLFIGSHGSGKWTGDLDSSLILNSIREAKVRLIPVLLPNVKAIPDHYRIQVQPVIFKNVDDSQALGQLHRSIKSQSSPTPNPDLPIPSPPIPSNKNRWEHFLAFWTTVPGIITAVASLITSLGGLYASGVLKAPTVVPSSPHSRELLHNIEVSASSESGISYKYSGDKAAKLEYEAAGTWQAIPKNYEGDEKVPKGYISADGYQNFTSTATTPCSANVGALVVKKPSGECVATGQEGTFEAKPGDIFTFIMNDTPDMYGDNTGLVTVQLYKTNK